VSLWKNDVETTLMKLIVFDNKGEKKQKQAAHEMFFHGQYKPNRIQN
jgi:hypothetical protein